MATSRIFQTGEPAPWFVCRSISLEQFHFNAAAGRYVVLCFFGSAGDPHSRRVLDNIVAQRQIFDDDNISFLGVSIDPDDEARLEDRVPGLTFLWDFERSVSRAYRAAAKDADGELSAYQRCSYVLDERLRVLVAMPFGTNPDEHTSQLLAFVQKLPALSTITANAPVPILLVPRVFEPQLCGDLVEYYESLGGEESGFVRDQEGKTRKVRDSGFKRRRDQTIVDESLRTSTMHRIHDRLAPEIYKAFQFRATRIERYLVACYDSAIGGHFRPHRDNTTKGTAHRRFAVSLNLNGDFEGGDLRFPEFGRQTYRAPIGGAVVFSCSLLHEATPIINGKRYAFLPFLYDEPAAKIREANRQYVAE
jgi:peroxiredoxin/predicted 2-oxoglutarate/Fe(II)-dependent dioxygenase YbiX